MKKMLSCFVLFLLGLLVLLLILIVYRMIFQIDYSVIVSALCAVCSFPIFILLCRYGQQEIKKQEKLIVTTGNHTASDRRIFALCLMRMSPVYWAFLMVAFIPIVSFGMFFLTIFPAFLFICMPLKIMCDTYHSFTRKRMPFLCFHVILTAVLAAVGQIPTQAMLV